ncbi:unnamed protein product, partial [Brenthis ino]
MTWFKRRARRAAPDNSNLGMGQRVRRGATLLFAMTNDTFTMTIYGHGAQIYGCCVPSFRSVRKPMKRTLYTSLEEA